MDTSSITNFIDFKRVKQWYNLKDIAFAMGLARVDRPNTLNKTTYGGTVERMLEGLNEDDKIEILYSDINSLVDAQRRGKRSMTTNFRADMDPENVWMCEDDMILFCSNAMSKQGSAVRRWLIREYIPEMRIRLADATNSLRTHQEINKKLVIMLRDARDDIQMYSDAVSAARFMLESNRIAVPASVNDAAKPRSYKLMTMGEIEDNGINLVASDDTMSLR